MVVMFISGLLRKFSIEYNVVVFPEPVGPETIIIPNGLLDAFCKVSTAKSSSPKAFIWQFSHIILLSFLINSIISDKPTLDLTTNSTAPKSFARCSSSTELKFDITTTLLAIF
ncbi:MAG: hypothetical protein BWY47_01310 [Bacteroidetes bacterium ADurb.Bin302]|nr:MAG: hypothetical protein BWY47_01310 [Bacteroidetes bacterium ADurb.Bin302]